MELRKIEIMDDFEKAYNILNQKEYPLSYYEFTLKHDKDYNHDKHTLHGVFHENKCLGMISYQVTACPDLGFILEINEIHSVSIKAYKELMNFMDLLAKDEKCSAIKICKNNPARMNFNLFDRVENFLKNIIH